MTLLPSPLSDPSVPTRPLSLHLLRLHLLYMHPLLYLLNEHLLHLLYLHLLLYLSKPHPPPLPLLPAPSPPPLFFPPPPATPIVAGKVTKLAQCLSDLVCVLSFRGVFRFWSKNTSSDFMQIVRFWIEIQRPKPPREDDVLRLLHLNDHRHSSPHLCRRS